jgi:YHS domain-containing protein
MKTLAISIFLILSSFLKTNQEATTIKATYEGVDDGVYYFSSEEDFNTYAFKNLEDAAGKKYNMGDRKLIGTDFEVTYTSEEFQDEENETFEVLTITDLLLIKKN